MGCCGSTSNKYKVKEAVRTAKNIVKGLAQGELLAKPVTKQKRLTVCGSCRDFDGRKCSVCGCFMSIKSGLENTNCPKGKW